MTNKHGQVGAYPATHPEPRRQAATLTMRDLGRELNLSQSMIKLLVRDGSIRTFRVGRRRLATAAALSAYIAEREAANG